MRGLQIIITNPRHWDDSRLIRGRVQGVRRAAFECLGRFELKKKVRLIGVRISNLEKAGNEGKK